MTNHFISKEPRYNLSYVVQETGIKADTLRAWERRYQLPQPQRTEGGHRLFSDFDIHTIKWLIARQGEGMSIGRAVRLWREIESNGQDTLPSPLTQQLPRPMAVTSVDHGKRLADLRSRWIQACLDFNEPVAEQVLSLAFAQFPLETVCVEILQSGLSTIGTLWQKGAASVHQEHFATELATCRIHALLAAAPKPVREKTILVGCPPGEDHTFSALMTTLLLRYRSWQVIYLGANVPREQIVETIGKTNPALVVMVAMRLATSASLYDMGLFLDEIDVPMAFGGWIFEHTSGLSQKIPGYYLGGDVLAGISKIENLLTGQMPEIEHEPRRDDFSEAIAHFLQHKHDIENQALDKIKSDLEEVLPLQNIQEANEFLAQDIIAALSLGDLSLIQEDLKWLENLITSHDIPAEMLFNYLFAYYEAAQAHLDEPGGIILDWLASIIQNKV